MAKTAWRGFLTVLFSVILIAGMMFAGAGALRAYADPENMSNSFYNYTYDAVTGGYKVSLTDAFKNALNGSTALSGTDASGTEITWNSGDPLPNPAPNGQVSGTDVTNMASLFASMNVAKLDLTKFNTSKVTNMESMFSDDYSVSEITFGPDFTTSNVTNMRHMFYGCYHLGPTDLGMFDFTNVTNFSEMFFGAAWDYNPELKPAKWICAPGWTSTLNNDGKTGINLDDMEFIEAASVKLHDNVPAGDPYPVRYGTNLTYYVPGTETTLPQDWSRAPGENDGVHTYYNFDGWYTNAACTGDAVTVIPADATGNQEFWAKWTLKEFEIKYDLTYYQPQNRMWEYDSNEVDENGVQNSNDNPATANIETDWTLKDPHRKGFTFKGWKRGRYNDSGDEIHSGQYIIYDEDVTKIDHWIPIGSVPTYYLRAQWEPISYTITYELDHGSFQDASEYPTSYTYIDSIDFSEFKEPTREGYLFEGLYWDQAFSNKVTKLGSKQTGNKTIYAKWSKAPHKVTFDAQGGDPAPDVQTVIDGEKATEPAEPTRAGYSFGGWYTDSACSDNAKYDFDTPVTKDITLYAKWTLNTVTVDDPPVHKTITGDKPPKDATFIFSMAALPVESTLPDGMTAMPMPGGADEQTVRATVVGSGSAEFGNITFSKAGTYVYEVKEVNSGEKNYTYDGSVYRITYTVTDENNKLVSARTITKDGEPYSGAAFAFENRYTAPKSDANGGKPGAGGSAGGPKTGDAADSARYIVLMLAAAGFAAALLRRRVSEK